MAEKIDMRILYLTGNGFPRSATDPRGTFSFEHVRALRALGAEVTAVDLQADDFGEDVVDGITIRRIPRLRPILRALAIGRLRRYLAAHRSLLHGGQEVAIFSFSYLKYFPLMLGIRRLGVTILVIPHGGDVMPGGAIRRFLKCRLFALADVITPVSDYTETLLSCLIKRRDADNDRIVTIYNGVDLAKLQTDCDPNKLRIRLGLPHDAFVGLSGCNLVKRKGVDVVIRAVSRLLAEGRDIHHVVIGRGPEAERLRTLARLSSKPANFKFMDTVSSAELANFYNMADVFAILSTTGWDARQTEGFGIVYAEAMALGTPVIGGRGSGTGTPVKDGFTGVLIDPYGEEVEAKVAYAMVRLMDDNEYRARLSRNAKWYVRETFSWERNARETLDVIAKVRN